MASRVALQGSQMRNQRVALSAPGRSTCWLVGVLKLQEELGDGSYKYDPPSGPVFKLPLEACLFVNVEQDIAYNRKNFVVGATAIANLTEEASKLDYG